MHPPPPTNNLILGLDHVNIQVPPNTLHLTRAFYTGTLGLPEIPVPPSSKGWLAWFAMGTSGQTIHISSQYQLTPAQLKAQGESPRHLCFKIDSDEKLKQLQAKIWQHYETGGEGAPVYCDEAGKDNNGAQGAPGEFPTRFFARDYAGNRLEFTL